LNPAFRAVSRIKNPADPVGAYAELDVRLAWQLRPRIQLSLVGQNLLHDHHLEFGLPLTGQKIERSVYGKATYRW
jgi:iron complex outermembrane recepter protein